MRYLRFKVWIPMGRFAESRWTQQQYGFEKMNLHSTSSSVSYSVTGSLAQSFVYVTGKLDRPSKPRNRAKKSSQNPLIRLKLGQRHVRRKSRKSSRYPLCKGKVATKFQFRLLATFLWRSNLVPRVFVPYCAWLDKTSDFRKIRSKGRFDWLLENNANDRK